MRKFALGLKNATEEFIKRQTAFDELPSHLRFEVLKRADKHYKNFCPKSEQTLSPLEQRWLSDVISIIEKAWNELDETHWERELEVYDY